MAHLIFQNKNMLMTAMEPEEEEKEAEVFVCHIYCTHITIGFIVQPQPRYGAPEAITHFSHG